MDIGKSYPENAQVGTWKRDLSFDKEKQLINLSEDYSLGQSNSLQHVFMTVANVDINQNGKIILQDQDAKLVINYDSKIWEVQTEFPSTEGMEYESFKTKWKGKQVQRILLTHKKPTLKGKHSFKMSFE
jgi:hypothetical protein